MVNLIIYPKEPDLDSECAAMIPPRINHNCKECIDSNSLLCIIVFGTLVLLIILMLCSTAKAATFTEFYVKTTGNVLNGGSDTNDASKCFLAGGFWTNSPAVFRKDASTFTNVAVGDFASVYPDGNGTNVFTAMVTNVTSTNVWMSLVAKTGTSPANDTAGATSIRIGGSWAGPNTNSASLTNTIFPFNFVATSMTNAPNVFPRVNFYGGTTYWVTNAITHANIGPIRFQGMTSTPGDGGKATIDGGATGVSYVLLTDSVANQDFIDLIFDHDGDSGSAASGVSITGPEVFISRVAIRNMLRYGLSLSSSGGIVSECEFSNCNLGNAANQGGVLMSTGSLLLRCISRDNTNSNSSGFVVNSQCVLIDCIAYNNGDRGFTMSTIAGFALIGCDAYSNGTSGLSFTASSASSCLIENCNFLRNVSFGITSATSSLRNGKISNCGFGSGSMTNSSGSINSTFTQVEQTGNITYASGVTPWVDPDHGNFSINLDAAKSAGRGQFLQTAVNSPTNTVGFPDIGAAQASDTNATTRAFGFSQ